MEAACFVSQQKQRRSDEFDMRNVCAFAHGGTFWNEEESGEQSE
jgi:hypothetical protein